MNFKLIKIIVSITVISIQNSTYCQTVLIKDKVPVDFSTLDEGIGPNRKHYSYSYFGIGKIIDVPISDSVFSAKWNALKISSGFTKKYQANKFLGLLFDFDLSFESYALNRLDSINTINYNPNLTKARYVFYKVSSDLAMQFNLRPKRGNQLGAYITVGGYVDYNVSRRFITKSQFNNGYEVRQKNVYRKPSFTTPFQYGAVAKFGKHYWDIFAKYRVSNAFDSGQTELSRLIIGVEILFHNRVK